MASRGFGYRPDIDGLRALAVFLVVFFHIDLGPFSGGFIGVDVFFVVSGFLITRLIVNEVATGSFSFSDFYVRRARRILPALFFTIGLSAIAAFLLFSPEHLLRFSRSMLAAVLSVSNILFWQESGYFDEASITKPLLHTWSLGVEEQFYILWPLFLILLLKGSARIAACGILAAAIASLWLNGLILSGEAHAWLREPASAVFFLTPFRIFEFAIGALMVWVIRLQPEHVILNEVLLLFALVMILYAAVTLNEASPFPYLNALVPCLGAALVIHSGTAPLGGLLLRNSIAVGLGAISYSVYLLHWPLIVFWTYVEFDALTTLEKLSLCSVTVFGAALMYRFVEQPFRKPPVTTWRPRYVAAASLTAACALTIPAIGMWLGDGLHWRLPDDRTTASNRELRTVERQRYCNNWHPSLPRDLVTCQNYRGATDDIFIWGDSHAQHLVAGFSETYPNHNVYVLYMSGCVPQSGFANYERGYRDPPQQAQCVERNRRAMEFFGAYPASTIILSNAKRATPEVMAKTTRLLLGELRRLGHNTFALADFIRPARDLRTCNNVPAWLLRDAFLSARCTADPTAERVEISYNRELAALLGPDFIDIAAAQCPDGDCIFVTDGQLLFRDTHHLTSYGAALFIDRLKPYLPIRDSGGRLTGDVPPLRPATLTRHSQ